MSKEKCCGNCRYFKNESIDGKGWCEEQSWVTECSKVCKLHEFGSDGWTEITPDNVDEVELMVDKIVVSHFVDGVEKKEFISNTLGTKEVLNIMSNLGGYYYYVLPELKIE